MRQQLFFGLVTALFAAVFAQAQPAILWEAYNDHRPSEFTHPNATTWDMRATDDGGFLRNFETGEDLPVSFFVIVEGDAVPDDFGANFRVATNTPAGAFFDGKVDSGNDGLPGIRSSANTKLILRFYDLDPTKRYNFRGTVHRGGGYDVRWSIFSITGADAYVHAHVDGSPNLNLFTRATFPESNIGTNQVVLNTGDNKDGSMIGWDNIEPGSDGTFDIEAEQYTGLAPFGDPSAGPYGYGLNVLYLAEIESTGPLRIVENPANQTVAGGTTATLRVVADSPDPITYQWQRSEPGAENFVDIPGATDSTYTTPALTAADSGARYRVVLSSGGAQTTSSEAILTVDAVIPSVTAARGSINFNSAYLTFSEPMKLATLGDTNNYRLSGGLAVLGAVALDPSNVRLLTSTQAMATRYTVTLDNIEDVAGNRLPPGTSISFNSFGLTTNVVGLEIWDNITGSAVADLTNNTRYPLSPDLDFAVPTLDSTSAIPDGSRNTYAGRLRAWLTPEETAEYEFFIRADDQGEFRISTDDSFDNLPALELEPTAYDTSSGDTFQEPGFDFSVSVPILLEAGRRYAVQAIWKEGNGNDYLQVAWRQVGDFTPAEELQPIPSRFFSYYGPVTVETTEPRILGVRLAGAQVEITFEGGGLQSTTDFVTWADETGTSPFLVSPSGEYKFYRARP